MKDTAIYTLTSSLHDANVVDKATREFLEGLHISYEIRGNDFSDYGKAPLSLIYVRTGGTEGQFKALLPQLLHQSHAPFYLLTSGKSNSLAASMEILSYLRQQGIIGEIIHGSDSYINHRIEMFLCVAKARRTLAHARLGVIGTPSDWLISSQANYAAIEQKFGINIVDIPMQELLDEHAKQTDGEDDTLEKMAPSEAIRKALPGALRIYKSLTAITKRHQLDGFTMRCFDLLSAIHNTSCIALAKLNAEGIVASCEGDVPAMLSMIIALALTGKTGFQANPASINVETGELKFAHCTIPLNMVDRFELDTHFESGSGVGVRGYMHGPVTIFKISGDGSRWFIEEGDIVRCEDKRNLCRTQLIIRLRNPQAAQYFLTNPIGNHHIIMEGLHKKVLTEFLSNNIHHA